MHRLSVFLVVWAVGCSSAGFDVAQSDQDSGSVRDVQTDETTVVTPDGAGPDSNLPPPDAPCVAISQSTLDVYVDATAPAGGKGASSCPFRTIYDAADAPLAAGTDRIVHVRAGTYNESGLLRIRSRETWIAEGGVAKVTVTSSTPCSPSAASCGVLMDASSTIDGFFIEAGGVNNGIFIYSTGAAPRIKNTTVRGAQKDGVFVTGTSAALGPNVAVIENGYSGVVMRGSGRLDVTGVGNRFDNNKGSYTSGIGAGIFMVTGSIFLDGGASTTGNNVGVLFDTGSGSTALQTLSQLTAQLNRGTGVIVGKGWTKFQLRKSVLTKNANFGLRLEWDDTRSNDFDIGKPGLLGGNVFGGSSQNNTKGSIFLCRSPTTGGQLADGNQWANCLPQQQMVTGCDVAPSTWADVAYFPHATVGSTLGQNPVATMTCSKGP
jgi:hypothetical protein